MIEEEQIFVEIKKILEKYAAHLSVTKNDSDSYELHGKKTVIVEYHSGKKEELKKKKYDRLFFTSIVKRKKYVGLYFFPIYSDPNEFLNIDNELKKCLKGKNCFHIKKYDSNLINSIEELIESGFNIYQKKSWI